MLGKIGKSTRHCVGKEVLNNAITAYLDWVEEVCATRSSAFRSSSSLWYVPRPFRDPLPKGNGMNVPGVAAIKCGGTPV